MLRIFIILIMLTSPVYAVTQWTATAVPTSASDLASNFPAEIYAQWAILQTLLQNYRQAFYLTYSNSSTLTVGAGEVSAWNGTAALFLQNTSSTSATTANLDTGSSFTASTTYYVYAGTSSTTAATATISISLNNTTPSNLTYYKQLGSFTTDGSGNISKIVDNIVIEHFGSLSSSYGAGSVYQATTDGIVLAVDTTTGQNMNVTIGITNPPTTTPCSGTVVSSGVGVSCSIPVAKGEYWKVTGSSASVYWRPLGQ